MVVSSEISQPKRETIPVYTKVSHGKNQDSINPQQLIDKHPLMTQCKSCINAEEIIHIQLGHDIE